MRMEKTPAEEEEEGLPNRQSLRLKGADYGAEGCYFVTIACHDRRRRFGEVREGVMVLNAFGQVANEMFERLPQVAPQQVKVPAWIVMPDHVHALISLMEKDRTTLARTIGVYKSMVHRQCLQVAKERNIVLGTLWQRNYYDHIVRDITDFHAIEAYIYENPLRWAIKHGQCV